MSNETLFHTLEEALTDATKSEKKIISYILKNRAELPFLPISGLADACGVGDATVSRFCRSLGYKGYSEFRMALFKAVSADLAQNRLLAKDDLLIRREDSVAEMAQKLLNRNVAAMSQTQSLLREESVRSAAQSLHDARNVYCFGQGASGIIAQDAWARFSTVSPRFHSIVDSHLQASAVSLCSAEDAILFFSYSGSTKDAGDVLRLARENGVRVILITHFQKSPATRYADVVLLCGGRETPLQTGSISAKIAQLYLVDVLFNEFCRLDPQTASCNRERTAQADAVKHL